MEAVIVCADHNPAVQEVLFIKGKSDPLWSFPMHAHPDALELSFVLDGVIHTECDGIKEDAKAGDMIIKNAGTIHLESTDQEQPVEMISLIVSGVHYQGFRQNEMPVFGHHVIPVRKNAILLADLFVFLRDHPEEEMEEARKKTVQLILELLLLSIPRFSHVRESEKTDLEATLQKVIAYINVHYKRKLSIEELADTFYISPFYLSRQFKQYTGHTIVDYISSRRMGEAQKLLLYTSHSVKKIASLCGYENTHYFYTVFKKHFMMTPVAYRKRYKREEVVLEAERVYDF